MALTPNNQSLLDAFYSRWNHFIDNNLSHDNTNNNTDILSLQAECDDWHRKFVDSQNKIKQLQGKLDHIHAVINQTTPTKANKLYQQAPRVNQNNTRFNNAKQTNYLELDDYMTSLDDESLNKLSTAQLMQRLRAHKLEWKGLKHELIERWKVYNSSSEYIS